MLWFSLASAALAAPQADTIWKDATMFACQCFCALTEYSNHQAALPVSTKFGFDVAALPLTRVDDMEHWMSDEKHYQVRKKLDRRGRVQGVLEYATGGIISSPPALSVGDRELLINELSKNEYAKLKKQMELDTQEGKAIEAKLLKLGEEFGVDLATPGVDDNPAYLHVLKDHRRYRSIDTKKAAWKDVCKRECKSVVQSDSRTFWFKPHNEFALYKQKIDPFATGRYYSDEVIHGRRMGSVPTKWKSNYDNWIATIGPRFDPLFDGLRYKDKTKCRSLRLTDGIRTSWRQLFAEHNVLKNPRYLYPPNRPRSIAVDGLNRIVSVGEDPFKKATLVLGEKKLKTIVPPVLIAYDDEIDWNATGTLGGWTTSRGINVAAWPASAPQYVSWRIGGEWEMRAIVAVAEGNQPDTFNMRVTSMWEGQPAGPQRINLFNILLTNEHAAELNQSMRSILINKWVSAILNQFVQSGGFGFVADLGEVIQEKQRVKRKSTGKSGQTAVKKIKRESAGVEMNAPNSLRPDEQEEEPIKNEENKPIDPDDHTDSDESDMSFIQLKKGHKPTTRGLQASIVAIEFIYRASVWLSCWHSEMRESDPATFYADNRLMLSVVPVKAIIYRDDNIKYSVPVEPIPLTVGFMSMPRYGVLHLEQEATRDIWLQMRHLRHIEATALLDVLYAYFDLKVPNSVITQRNTCPLPNDARDLILGEIMPAQGYLLYLSPDMANIDRKRLQLPGIKFRSLIGTMLLKCFNVLPPGGVVFRQDGKGSNLRYTCSDIPSKREFSLIQSKF